MKKDFNRATKSDMPLEVDAVITRSSSTPRKTTSTKPKITKIGNGTAKKVTSSKTRKTTTSSTSKKTTTLNQKLGKDKVSNKDLEKLNEESIQKHSFRTRRNIVIIILLIMLIFVAVLSILLYAMTLTSDANCFLYLKTTGSVDASFVVENQYIEEFRTPNEFGGGRRFIVDLDLQIDSGGQYKVSFYYECFVGNELMENILPYEPNRDLFRKNHTNNTYETITSISGNQTVDLLQGIEINTRYSGRVNANNFSMKFYLNIERI